jgi:death-on-curing protein
MRNFPMQLLGMVPAFFRKKCLQKTSDGVRDEKLLESALETPFQSFGGEELYPSTQAKAARLCYGLVKNHAMVDGNKRIGTHVMLVFLTLNGYELEYTQKELSDTILDVAAGHMSYGMKSA